MKRRTFLSLSAAGTTGLSVVPTSGEPPAKPVKKIGKIGDYSLDDLRTLYRSDLFEDFLPFFDRYVIDHELGGFMCTVDRDGARLSTEKRAGYAGRGIMVYSCLYRYLDPNPKYLDVAQKTLEFLMRARPQGDALWAESFTREGKPLGGTPQSVNTDMYIADGISEYAHANGDEQYWETAGEILFKCLKIYDTPGYLADAGKGILGENAPASNGFAVMDDWMLFLRLATRMLEFKSDPEVESVANRCVDTIMNNFYNTGSGLINEFLNRDLSRPDNDLAQYISFGNNFQAQWHVLYEAVRRKDKKLFDTAAERFRHHIETAWDDVYGGFFGTLSNVDKNIWALDKIAYVQEESLIGLLCIIEHTGAEWAREWFSRIYAYVRGKFPLKQYGFSLWIVSSDRKVTFVRHANRAENFHHPRHLLLNLLAIGRINKRGGKTSGIFA
ncbi:MAG: AGE family epimerase/isomerase [Candidatus Latescibacterota bacterium]